MIQVPAAARALARQVISHEAGGSKEPVELMVAAERVEGRLRGRLAELFGLIGYAELLARALRLAQTEIPELEPVTVKVQEGGLSGVRDFVEFVGADGADSRAAEDGLTSILAHVIGLLGIFIGEDLALRLVREGWPELGQDQAALEG